MFYPYYTIHVSFDNDLLITTCPGRVLLSSDGLLANKNISTMTDSNCIDELQLSLQLSLTTKCSTSQYHQIWTPVKNWCISTNYPGCITLITTIKTQPPPISIVFLESNVGDDPAEVPMEYYAWTHCTNIAFGTGHQNLVQPNLRGAGWYCSEDSLVCTTYIPWTLIGAPQGTEFPRWRLSGTASQYFPKDLTFGWCAHTSNWIYSVSSSLDEQKWHVNVEMKFTGGAVTCCDECVLVDSSTKLTCVMIIRVSESNVFTKSNPFKWCSHCWAPRVWYL